MNIIHTTYNPHLTPPPPPPRPRPYARASSLRSLRSFETTTTQATASFTPNKKSKENNAINMRNHLKETHPFTQPPNHHEKPPKITLSGARGWVRDNLKKILFFLRFASSFPWDIRGKPASIEEKENMLALLMRMRFCLVERDQTSFLLCTTIPFCSALCPLPKKLKISRSNAAPV